MTPPGVDGRPVQEYPLRHLRDAIAMVLQKNTLFSGTVRDNLRWGKEDASQEEIEQACHIACVDEFIDRQENGYDTDLGQGGVNVSGGQKQRLCIARAILKKPKVLILDVYKRQSQDLWRGAAEPDEAGNRTRVPDRRIWGGGPGTA